MMPGKGTPKRGIRIDDGLWGQARDKAKRLGVDLSGVQRELLREWVEAPDDEEVASNG